MKFWWIYHDIFGGPLQCDEARCLAVQDLRPTFYGTPAEAVLWARGIRDMDETWLRE